MNNFFFLYKTVKYHFSIILRYEVIVKCDNIFMCVLCRTGCQETSETVIACQPTIDNSRTLSEDLEVYFLYPTTVISRGL